MISITGILMIVSAFAIMAILAAIVVWHELKIFRSALRERAEKVPTVSTSEMLGASDHPD
jgi:hypothetical protein